MNGIHTRNNLREIFEDLLFQLSWKLNKFFLVSFIVWYDWNVKDESLISMKLVHNDPEAEAQRSFAQSS